jgi:hypothetical protein
MYIKYLCMNIIIDSEGLKTVCFTSTTTMSHIIFIIDIIGAIVAVIDNYLCNQCLSPLMLWVRISIRARCTTLCDKVCQWLATDQWFSSGPYFPREIEQQQIKGTMGLLSFSIGKLYQVHLVMDCNQNHKIGTVYFSEDINQTTTQSWPWQPLVQTFCLLDGA